MVECETCGDIGIVALVDQKMVAHCPDCRHEEFLEDCRDLGIDPDTGKLLQ